MTSQSQIMPNKIDITRQLVESLDPKVRKVDSDDNVDLFCYSACSSDDIDTIKECRGIVFNGDELVLNAFSYTSEYTTNEVEMFEPLLNDQCRFFDSYEGSIIRVFYNSNKWYVSTHRRLDAFRSKWSSKQSFGEIFVQALEHEQERSAEFNDLLPDNDNNVMERYLSTLNRDFKYMFLVQNIDDNRIVCKATDKARVFHVGTYTQDGFDLSHQVGIPYPTELSFDSVDELIEHVDNGNVSRIQGVIVFDGNKQFKVLNQQYKHYFDIRGNEPSIKFRYLQLRMDNTKREDLIYLYPTHSNTFDIYEDAIYDLVIQIKNAYIKRFINKETVTMPTEEYSIMKLIHGWHLEDRAANHISTSVVRDIMNKQSPTKLNRMIRRFLNTKVE
jgi:hypothetical protein